MALERTDALRSTLVSAQMSLERLRSRRSAAVSG
jgi:hypothetical protein